MSLAKERVTHLSLVQLLPTLGLPVIANDIVVKDITLDSRRVTQGAVFVAIKGHSLNGESFIGSAISLGASAILKEGSEDAWSFDSESKQTLIICLKNLNRRIGAMASQLFGEPSSKLTLVGITGTNGKTSCADYLLQLWTEQKINAASLGTLGWKVAGGEYHPTGLTTLDAVENQRMMSRFLASGIDHIVMEVSSHGIDQGRVDALKFDVKALTNITRDHLDYHGDFENYAKTKLDFIKSEKALPDAHYTVINIDDEIGAQYFESIPSKKNIASFSLRKTSAGVFCQSIKQTPDGFLVRVSVNESCIDTQVGLIGEFNLSNLLLVLAVQMSLDVDLESYACHLCKVNPALGRLENIGKVFVDYAHTPDALENVLLALKPHCKDKLIVVFGCGGNRDKGKRPMMAAVAEKFADTVVVTTDNPRSEKPESIVKDIVSGFHSAGEHVVELDRARAIKKAIAISGENDLVLVAGKGHEDYQEVNGLRLKFSDVEEIKKVVGLR